MYMCIRACEFPSTNSEERVGTILHTNCKSPRPPLPSGNCGQNKGPEGERTSERERGDEKVRIVSCRMKGPPLVHRTTGSVWTNQAEQPQRRETFPGIRVSPALRDRLEDLRAFLRHLNQHQRSLRCLESHQTVDKPQHKTQQAGEKGNVVTVRRDCFPEQNGIPRDDLKVHAEPCACRSSYLAR